FWRGAEARHRALRLVEGARAFIFGFALAERRAAVLATSRRDRERGSDHRSGAGTASLLVAAEIDDVAGWRCAFVNHGFPRITTRVIAANVSVNRSGERSNF